MLLNMIISSPLFGTKDLYNNLIFDEKTKMYFTNNYTLNVNINDLIKTNNII